MLLLDLPDEIQTERLTLRVPSPGDEQIINAAIMSSADEVGKWLKWATNGQTLDETTEFVRRAQKAFILREWLSFFLYRDGECLGSVSLNYRKSQVWEIGYWLKTSATGKGYMTEAARAMCAYGFNRLEAHRLYIRCDPRNVASANVAIRLGFKQEAHLRNYERDTQGELSGSLFFGMLREEWQA